MTEVNLFACRLQAFYVESSGLDFFSVTMRAFISDNAGVAANGVAVYGVIY